MTHRSNVSEKLNGRKSNALLLIDSIASHASLGPALN